MAHCAFNDRPGLGVEFKSRYVEKTARVQVCDVHKNKGGRVGCSKVSNAVLLA